MNIIEPILLEFAHETVNTRIMFNRIPEEKLAWKPHEKSMALGRLAGHIAESPQWLKTILDTEEMVLDLASYKPTEFTSRAQILDVFDEGVTDAQIALNGRSNTHMMAVWRLKRRDADGGPERIILEAPRIAVVRGMVLNHMVHHRGQLSVYFRLLDVPLPAIYGPSADEGK